MKPLTKNDLEFLDRIGAWTHRGLKTKILKNQEDTKILESVKKDRDVAVEEWKKCEKDAKKFEMVDSLFAELEIPLPYDLWLVNSLKNNKIVEHMKKLLDTYKNEEWEEEFLRKMVVRELQETFSLEEGKAVAEAQWTGIITDIPIKVEYDPKYKETIKHLKKLCHDNRNINGLLDLESFHGEVQKILEGKK